VEQEVVSALVVELLAGEVVELLADEVVHLLIVQEEGAGPKA
jgi:hypothetical protein